MAISVCPECGGKVSTLATACPHCGCPAGAFALPPRPLTPEPTPVRPAPAPKPPPSSDAPQFEVPSRDKPGRRLTYPAVVIGLTLIVVGWHLFRLATDTRDTPPTADAQTVALYANSWKLTGGAGGGGLFDSTFLPGSVWTFSREGLEAGQLDSDGEHSRELFGTSSWTVVEAPGTLVIRQMHSDTPREHSYLVRLRHGSLTLEEANKPAADALAFTAMPRVPRGSSGGAPFWYFVLLQAVAALVAHVAAREWVTRSGRFWVYLAVNLLSALLLGLTLFLFKEKGFLAGLGTTFGYVAMAVMGLVIGVVGGVVHAWNRPAAPAEPEWK